MSIDFATLKGLTIPEGVVTQIADAAGNVLWSADNGMRKITITRNYAGSNSGRIYIGGYTDDRYMDGGSCVVDGTYGDWTSPTTIEVPVGAQIILETEYEDSYTEFFINGVSVYNERTDYAWYDQYTVSENATVAMTREWIGQDKKYVITITEE